MGKMKDIFLWFQITLLQISMQAFLFFYVRYLSNPFPVEPKLHITSKEGCRGF